MRFTLRSRHEGRVRQFVFVSSPLAAEQDAIHLLQIHLRTKKGIAGEVWKHGTIDLRDARGRAIEINSPIYLEVVQG